MNPAGVQLRQGIAHLINKASFVQTNSNCGGIVCVPNDNPLPLCSIFSCSNGGLPNPNPCAWDASFPENSSANCVVGAPGGTAYNCTYSTACPTGTVVGGPQFPWQPSIGSADFCAAAAHFTQAFKAQLNLTISQNSSCELLPPSGGWPASATALATTCSGVASTADVCFFVRDAEPRLDLGRGLAQEICALFSPAFAGTGWTTLSGQPTTCNPFIQETEGPISSFCGFVPPSPTEPPPPPDLCWGIYTGAFGGESPFDTSVYFEYNSIFAPQTVVTCLSANCSSTMAGSTCISSTSQYDNNYMWTCSPSYDSISSKMENAPCLYSTGDPALGQPTATFANCPGTSSLSAISAGYQAVDLFGRNVFTLPIFSANNYYLRLSNWSQGGSTPGISTAVGDGLNGLPNYFNWLNAYSASPPISGTIRQGFSTTTDGLNPFDATSPWDFYVLGEIYDSLFEPNPLCSISGAVAETTCSQPLQLIDWMTTSHKFLCYSGGPSCNATMLGYGNSTYFADTTADLRLTLNRNNHWQDGGPVTAWDVKYSFVDLNATGAFQASGLANIAHVNVLDEFTLDLNLKAKGPFTEALIGGVTIIPGHIWSACGASNWNNGVTGQNIAGANIVNAAEDTCVGVFGAPSIVCPPPVTGACADSPLFDPVANNFLMGSGPFSCQSIGGTGHPAVGTLGGGCSLDNTQSPSPGPGDFTLTRTGCTLTSSGTICGMAGSGNDYFRSSGALAKYIWTGDVGSASADFSKVLTVNSCHSSMPSTNCPHWAQGIGNPGGTGSNPVGLSQRLVVNSFKGVSWIGFGTEQTAGTRLTLTCAAGYTLPATTITPCTSANAGWTGVVLPGIGTYASTLYEVGSMITIGTTTTGTSTLSPASIVGCNTTYPNGGYDC